MRKIIIMSVVIILVIVALPIVFNGRFTDDTIDTTPESEGVDKGDIQLDLDGDGSRDYVVVKIPEEGGRNIESMIAYNSSDEEIGRLPEGMPIQVPIPMSFRTYNADLSDKAEIFSMDFTVGPHQGETMFFWLYEGAIYPVCFVASPKGPYDCLFYSGNVGYMPAVDLDDDGFMEVIETTDEYPEKGELTSEEKEAIESSFSEQGVDESAELAGEIAAREKGGRGRTVVWAIYSYNGAYFEQQLEDDYEKYYLLIGDLIPNNMRKSELSEGSLEYLEGVRSFWSGK